MRSSAKLGSSCILKIWLMYPWIIVCNYGLISIMIFQQWYSSCGSTWSAGYIQSSIVQDSSCCHIMQSNYIFILILTIFHIFQFFSYISFYFLFFIHCHFDKIFRLWKVSTTPSGGRAQWAKIKLHNTKKIYENGQIYEQNSY